jgi:heterotetrameric sarcosine oxidase gamma subunit
MPGEVPGLQIETSASDIVEIAALRGRARDLERIALGRGVRLPALGRAVLASDHVGLCVRPERWLILTPPASAGASAALWQPACAGFGAALDLSSGLTALELTGCATREVLVRSCRIDLDPDAFPVGAAAATIMVQVAVILAALPSGVLLLTPSSTARHVHEWLVATAKPFGLMPASHPNGAAVSADKLS